MNLTSTELASFVQDVVRDVFFTIDKIVYMIVAFIYKVFYYVATAEFMTSDIVQGILSRVGIFLGVVMLFNGIFSLLQMLLNPDTMNDKDKGLGKLIFRIVFVVVMLASVNLIFNEMYDLQSILIKNDVIGKIVTGNANSVTPSNKSVGINFSKNLFFSFFRDDHEEFVYNVSVNETTYCLNRKQDGCNANNYIEDLVDDTYYFTNVVPFVNLKGAGRVQYAIEYNYLLSTLVGVFACYILITYCFGVGVRVFELAYLQIISPIPIISYLSKKGEERFNKWVKQCVSSYLDLFVRLLVINLAMHLVTLLFEEDRLTLVETIAGESPFTRDIIVVVLVLSILMFASKAPKLIKELLPGDGRYSLNMKDVFKDNLAGKAVGFVGATTWLGARKFNAAIDSKRAGEGFGKGWRSIHNDKSKFGKLRKEWEDSAPYRKDRVKATESIAHRNSLIEDGADIYYENKGELTANSFKNIEYRESFESVDNAKRKVAAAENELAMAQANLNRNPNNSEAKERYEAASKTAKGAQGELEFVKARHEDVKKKYLRDAYIEDSFGAFKKATDEGAHEAAKRAGKKGYRSYVKNRANSGVNTSSNEESSIGARTGIQGATGNGFSFGNSSGNDSAIRPYDDDGGEAGE